MEVLEREEGGERRQQYKKAIGQRSQGGSLTAKHAKRGVREAGGTKLSPGSDLRRTHAPRMQVVIGSLER
jgi:hypothetical protein